jgi:hypothetical protein
MKLLLDQPGHRAFLLGALLAALLFCACERVEGCSQEAVNDCFAEFDCTGSETCVLTIDEMNALCDCLGDLHCENEWYHELCDDAPYSPDAGCPMCEE